MRETKIFDKRPTMAEWPVRIWGSEEIPEDFRQQALTMLGGNFERYSMVYAPVRSTVPDSFAYLFGYGEDEIFYLKECQDRVEQISLKREQITEASTERELLNAKIILRYGENGEERTLELFYVPSVYYLYDPLLNWVLGLDPKFNPVTVEQEHPRPVKLYHESLAMFNYSLNAYRLGENFDTYTYHSEQHRNRWMPWKKLLEEWLEVPMNRGTFRLHSVGYFTECSYRIAGKGV